jgi:hypothetical protein
MASLEETLSWLVGVPTSPNSTLASGLSPGSYQEPTSMASSARDISEQMAFSQLPTLAVPSAQVPSIQFPSAQVPMPIPVLGFPSQTPSPLPLSFQELAPSATSIPSPLPLALQPTWWAFPVPPFLASAQSFSPQVQASLLALAE